MNRYLSKVRKRVKIRNQFDKREALRILMQYEAELMYTFGTMAFNSFV